MRCNSPRNRPASVVYGRSWPYGGHATFSQPALRAAAPRRRACTSALLPMPMLPSRSMTARVPDRSGARPSLRLWSSASRPRCCSLAAPRRTARDCPSTTKLRTGMSLPRMWTLRRMRRRNALPRYERVASPIRMPPTGAACSRRAATLTASPMTVKARLRREPIGPANTTPVLMPMRISNSQPICRRS